MRQPVTLESGLIDLTLIRTTYNILLMFRDDPIQSELRELIGDARHNFIRFLQELSNAILAAPNSFKIDYEQFRTNALSIMQRGYPCRDMNSFMKVDVFDGAHDALYYFTLPGLTDIDAARKMSALQFFVLLLNAILEASEDEGNFEGKATFDVNIFQKYIAMIFLHYAAGDPKFYSL